MISYEEIRCILNRLINAIDYMERIDSLPDCNNCGNKMNCEFVPNYGGNTRINCPLWKRKDGET